jgi:hypothetical protein
LSLLKNLSILKENFGSADGLGIGNCFECQNQNKKQCLYTTCSELVFFWDRSRKSMNNLLSYCGLTDAGMNASEKDLPVGQLKSRIQKCAQNNVLSPKYLN